MEKNEWEKDLMEEFTRLVQQSEELETVNIGTREDKKELKIRILITSSETKDLIALLREYVDVFAWSYADISSLDTDIVVHKIPLKE
jgi:hypothetical protein